MAELILRPINDLTLEHSCSSGSSGWMLINEATADDDAGYIYQIISNTTEASIVTSTFKLGGNIDNKIRITGLKVVYRFMSTSGNKNYVGGCDVNISVDGQAWRQTTNLKSADTTYNTVTISISIPSSANTTFNNLDAANILVSVKTGGGKQNSKQDDFQIRVTQLYSILTYEEVSEPQIGAGIFIKHGSWTKAKAVYKKVNGVWVEQDAPQTLFSGSSTGSESNYIYCGEISS